MTASDPAFYVDVNFFHESICVIKRYLQVAKK